MVNGTYIVDHATVVWHDWLENFSNFSELFIAVLNMILYQRCKSSLQQCLNLSFCTQPF